MARGNYYAELHYVSGYNNYAHDFCCGNILKDGRFDFNIWFTEGKECNQIWGQDQKLKFLINCRFFIK